MITSTGWALAVGADPALPPVHSTVIGLAHWLANTVDELLNAIVPPTVSGTSEKQAVPFW